MSRVSRAGCVEQRNGLVDFCRRLIALYGDGNQQHVQAGVAAAHDRQKVADHRAGRRGDYAHRAWISRQRPFARGVEHALRLEPFLQLLKGQLQRARTHRLHGLGHQLHLAALLVNAHPSAHQHLQAVLRPEAQQQSLAAKQDDGQLRVGIFEREVEVARGRRAIVGDFAFDPHIGILLLDELADAADQLPYRPHVARGSGLVKGQVELRRKWVGRAHAAMQFNRYGRGRGAPGHVRRQRALSIPAVVAQPQHGRSQARQREQHFTEGLALGVRERSVNRRRNRGDEVNCMQEAALGGAIESAGNKVVGCGLHGFGELLRLPGIILQTAHRMKSFESCTGQLSRFSTIDGLRFILFIGRLERSMTDLSRIISRVPPFRQKKSERMGHGAWLHKGAPVLRLDEEHRAA